jgi:hypothetical protein
MGQHAGNTRANGLGSSGARVLRAREEAIFWAIHRRSAPRDAGTAVEIG